MLIFIVHDLIIVHDLSVADINPISVPVMLSCSTENLELCP